MKLLLVSDLHYTLKQWDWLGAAADRFDLVVVAGDLLDIASIVPLEAQIVVVRKYLQRLADKATVLVSSGNHDIEPAPHGGERRAAWLLQDRTDRLRVDGDSFEQSGHFFSILPWWDGPETREAVERQIASQASRAGDKGWIWVYHPPPHGASVAWNGRTDLGDTSLSKWIQRFRPNMILGGHIHNAPFFADGSWIDVIGGTWVFNSGQQPGGVPAFTVIDLAANHARWFAAAEAEEAALVEPLVRRQSER